MDGKTEQFSVSQEYHLKQGKVRHEAGRRSGEQIEDLEQASYKVRFATVVLAAVWRMDGQGVKTRGSKIGHCARTVEGAG